MGFLGDFVAAVSDANEGAHGVRLRKEFDDSIRRLASFDARDEVIRTFVARRGTIRREMKNWSRDGRLSRASELRKMARESFDLNLVESYALWMTSSWLEAGNRQSEDAQHVWRQLDQLGAQHDSIEADEKLMARARAAIESVKEDERRKQADSAKADALRERKQAAYTVHQEVQTLLRERFANGEAPEMTGSLRRAVRRIVEIGFKTSCAPDLRHVDWRPEPSDTVIACCVGFAIATADATSSDPALQIALCSNYLESQGCGSAMRQFYTGQSLDSYYARPEAKLGVAVRTARDAMEAYLDGDRAALETLKSAFV